MKISTKQVLIILAVLLVILAVTGFYFYKKGKKKVTAVPLPSDKPVVIDGEVQNNPFGLSRASIAELSEQLYSDMKGLTILRDNDLYSDWLRLSDTDFVDLYNIFNSKHQADSGATLKEWLYGEVGVWGSDFNALKKDILTRMSRLNLA